MKKFKRIPHQSLLIISSLLLVTLISCTKTEDQKILSKQGDQEFSIIVQTKGMVCTFCSNNVEKHLSELDEINAVSASASENKVRIKLNQDQNLSKALITQTISDAGYEVEQFLKYPEKSMGEN